MDDKAAITVHVHAGGDAVSAGYDAAAIAIIAVHAVFGCLVAARRQQTAIVVTPPVAGLAADVEHPDTARRAGRDADQRTGGMYPRVADRRRYLRRVAGRDKRLSLRRA